MMMSKLFHRVKGAQRPESTQSATSFAMELAKKEGKRESARFLPLLEPLQLSLPPTLLLLLLPASYPLTVVHVLSLLYMYHGSLLCVWGGLNYRGRIGLLLPPLSELCYVRCVCAE